MVDPPPKTPEIQPHEIEVKDTIGVGAFGKVIRGKCRGKDVAIKILHKPITDEDNLIAFKKEVAIMSTIFHPNICLFMGACTQPGTFFIVQEFMPGGDVEKLLRNPENNISLYRRMQMAKDAALGVNWLHCSNPAFIHRDLKSSNLLIDENGKVKVCDFGLAQAKPQTSMLHDEDHAKGTPLWMAPEVMQFKEFNEKADVYSFGIVLWELLTRKEPFAQHTNYSKFRKAVCIKNERPEIPEDTEPSLRNLIQRCWDPDPNVRPSFRQIISYLDNVIIDVAVQDKIGRKLWQTKFLARDDVPWTEFSDALVRTLNLPINDTQHKERFDLNLKCLKALLATQPKVQTTAKSETVALRNWGKILQWFGPIRDPTTTSHTATFMDDITNILKQPWFHGDTDLQRAQELLSGKPAGTFMIRFSSLEGWYTISQIHGRIIQHQRIGHQPGDPYVIENDSYNSLFELVEQRNLKQPCDGSRYTLLFLPEGPDTGYPGYFNTYKV